MVRGEVDDDFLVAMRQFREWAVRIATEQHNPDWIMSESTKKENEFAFSLEAYNYFAAHSCEGFKELRDEEELLSLLNAHSKHLYKDESAIRLKKSRFFMLPDKILEFDFKRNK